MFPVLLPQPSNRFKYKKQEHLKDYTVGKGKAMVPQMGQQEGGLFSCLACCQEVRTGQEVWGGRPIRGHCVCPGKANAVQRVKRPHVLTIGCHLHEQYKRLGKETPERNPKYRARELRCQEKDLFLARTENLMHQLESPCFAL